MKRCINNVRRGVKVAACVVGLGGVGVLQPATAQPIAVEVNGAALQFDGARPLQRNGRVLVPMRSIFEALGASVQWDPATRMIHADRGVNHISMTIGQRGASVNGRSLRLEQPARLYRGSTYVPLRFVGEALGSGVRWSPVQNAIYITDRSGSSTTIGMDTNTVRMPQRGKNLSPMKVNGNFMAPVNGATVRELPRIKGTARALSGGAISRVGVQLWRGKGERGYDFWTPGVGWRATEFTMDTDYNPASGEWELTKGLPTIKELPAGNYVMQSIAYDENNRPAYVALGELKVVR